MKWSKKVLPVFLAATMMAGTACAIEGGDNQILPGVDTAVPGMMAKAWEDVQVLTVPYKNLESGEQLQMIICLPPENASENPAARPCIVMTRGSGLRAVTVNDFLGKENDQQLVRGMMLAKQGYVVAAVEFRGYTTEPVGSGTFPAALQDIRAAVRFLKANAETYGIDTEKFGSIGQSSGGYESGILGVTNGAWAVEVPEDAEGAAIGELYFSEADADAAIAAGKTVVKLDTAAGDVDPNAVNFNSAVTASVDLYGIAKIDEIGEGEFQHTLAANTAQEEVKFMTGEEVLEIWETPYVHTAANPYWYFDETDANELNMLFVHGTADTRVYPSSTEKFYNNCKANNVNAYRFLIPDAGHGGDRFGQDDLYTLLSDFYAENLKGENGNRVIVFPAQGGSITVSLNGEDVTETPWKLNNLSAQDKVTVQATADENSCFSGMVIETIDDNYVVETKTVYTSTVQFDGSACVNVTANFLDHKQR